MRILIDLQACQSGSRFGGIGRYSMSLAKAMLKLNSGHDISLLLNSSLPNENFIRAEFSTLMPQRNIQSFAVPAYVAAENNLPAYTRMGELIREKRIAEIDPDVLHIASLFEGAGEDVVTSVGRLFPAERTAVTLYDLIPYLQQRTYLTNQILADHYLGKFEALQHAGMVVAISDFSRTEGLENTAIPANRIVNISSAVDSQFRSLKVADVAKLAILQKFGIEKEFLMFTGSFDIRKNHDRLVKAFAKVPTTIRQRHQLVIIGKGEDHQKLRLKDIAKMHGLAEGDLLFVGHITDADLIALYNLCAVFVFPSLSEGFGLPPLEAMSCGAPTIGSDRTSIPEVIGRADALFDPEDVDDIAAKITAVLSNASFSTELREYGLARAKHFSWEISATRAIKFFEEGFERTSAGAGIRSSPDADCAQVYENFLAAVATLHVEELNVEFLDSVAHVIAVNELLARTHSADFDDGFEVGWVVDWDSKGPRIPYAKALIEAVSTRPLLFAPRLEVEVGRDDLAVTRCWEARGDIGGLEKALSAAIVDIVGIQYPDDLFELSELAMLIKQQREHNRQVFVILNSTQQLAAVSHESGLLEIRKALKSCACIFVHTSIDAKNLEEFKVRKNVHFLPDAMSNELSLSGGLAATASYLRQKISCAIACTDW